VGGRWRADRHETSRRGAMDAVLRGIARHWPRGRVPRRRLLLPKLMNKRDGDRSFTDRGRHPLNVGTANSHGDPPRGRT
jgi:hypothetical protein